MFREDIYAAITADASINELADYILVKEINPENYDDLDQKEDTIIVIDYDKVSSESTRGDRDFLSTWELYLYVSSPDSDKLNSLTGRLQEYLEEFKSDNILFIEFSGAPENYDNEDDIFYIDLEFEVLYSK